MKRALLLALVLASAPAFAQLAGAQQVGRAALLDQLFSALRVAPDEAAATALEGRIRALWLGQASPAVGLLMSRAERELQANEAGAAVDDFTAAITLQPDFAMAYEQRAVARFHLNDGRGAVADIEAEVAHEPRDFDAFDHLSRFAEAQEDWKGAYAAWQKVMEIDPQTADGSKRLNDLRRRALGEDM